jgi:Xaa-Pro aminopeptidase
MYEILTKEELLNRQESFRSALDLLTSDWNTAVIISKVNQYYLEGTMQDGILIIKRDGGAYYFTRRSFERAKNESPLDNIYKMESYRDAAAISGADFGNTYIETDIATISVAERIKKYFNVDKLASLDKAILSVRMIKTAYERYWMERAGALHNEFYLSVVPTLLREGISEADFVAELYAEMVKFGHQGICRFGMFQTEMVAGQVGFGDSSLYPTSFDGPGGARGISPAVPLLGSRKRKLQKGDLVFVDVGFGINGYISDKTQVYMFGAKPSAEVLKIHRACIDIQNLTAEMLRPGCVPSEIYDHIINSLSDDFMRNFMGYGGRQVKFLGHGIGLHVDEPPVIANGFTDPLEENTVIALEPKKGIPGIGMVGVEDTFFVTSDGGKCITGGGSDIILV